MAAEGFQGKDVQVKNFEMRLAEYFRKDITFFLFPVLQGYNPSSYISNFSKDGQ